MERETATKLPKTYQITSFKDLSDLSPIDEIFDTATAMNRLMSLPINAISRFNAGTIVRGDVIIPNKNEGKIFDYDKVVEYAIKQMRQLQDRLTLKKLVIEDWNIKRNPQKFQFLCLCQMQRQKKELLNGLKKKLLAIIKKLLV